MTEYLLMLWENQEAHAKATPADYQQLLEAHAAFRAHVRSQVTVHGSNRLRPVGEAKRVTITGGKPLVIDGPFTETKEVLGGYYVFSAPDLDTATRLASEFPCLAGDSVEVRPIMGRRDGGGAQDMRGKAFFFGVLGSAATEQAWSEVMDRIDAETSDALPAEMLSGARLEAPSTGRRVHNDRGKRVVQDGPFAEAKEVIGGLLLLRHGSIEDAVRWARDSRFVHHGTLEVRELWWM